MGLIANWRLRRAVTRGDVVAVRNLANSGASVEAKGPQGDTCLMLAASLGHAEVVQALCSLGANVNAVSTVGGRWPGFTALMAACGDSTGSVSVVQTLIELGADTAAVDSEGRAALDYAEISGRSNIVSYLRTL